MWRGRRCAPESPHSRLTQQAAPGTPGPTPSLDRPVPTALLPWPLLDLPELQASGPVLTALDFWAEFSSHPKPLSLRPSTKGRSCVMGLLLDPQLVLGQDPLTRSPGFSRVPWQTGPAEGHGQEEPEPSPQGNRAASGSAAGWGPTPASSLPRRHGAAFSKQPSLVLGSTRASVSHLGPKAPPKALHLRMAARSLLVRDEAWSLLFYHLTCIPPRDPVTQNALGHPLLSARMCACISHLILPNLETYQGRPGIGPRTRRQNRRL